MSEIPRTLLMLLSLLMTAGCVTESRGRQMERDIVALRAQFDELRSEKERLNTTLDRASKEMDALERRNKEATDVLRRNSADFGVQMDTLRMDVQRLRGVGEESKHEVEQLRKEIAALKERLAVLEEEAKKPKGPPPLPTEKDALYAHAYQAFMDKKNVEAIRGFHAYAERFPRDKRADNAIFFVGETLIRQGRHADAVVALQKILTAYPDGDKEDDAVFRIGESFEILGKCNESRVFFEDLVSRHKDSPHTKVAKKRLKKKCP